MLSLYFLPGEDPDAYVGKHGVDNFIHILNKSIDFLEFLVQHRSKTYDITTPTGKNQLAIELAAEIRLWDQPLLIHESLLKLSTLLKIPPSILGVGQEVLPNVLIKRSAVAGFHVVDPDRIMETDFLRILFVEGGDTAYVNFAMQNLKSSDLVSSPCRMIYDAYIEAFKKNQPRDLLTLAIAIEDPEIQVVISDLHQRKINREKNIENFKECITKILNRNWMQRREAVRIAIQSGDEDDDRVFLLTKEFSELKKNPPKLQGEFK